MKVDTLTRSLLVKKLAYELGFETEIAKEIVDGFFNEITQSLIDGEDVKITSFGNFNLKDKNERVGRNPKTNQEIKILPRRVVVFKPSQKLRDFMQEKTS